ncbi:response regulator [Elusimicrobiota bacterium]
MKVLCVSSNKKLKIDAFKAKNGYEFVMARQGNGLLEKIEEESPDLILLYVDKQCNGVSILKEQHPDIPLLVVSDEKEIERKIDCLEQGADSYIHSSIISEKLFMKIKALVRSYEWQRMRCI